MVIGMTSLFNVKDKIGPSMSRTQSDDTVFHVAAYNKREDIFERLLKLLPWGTDHEHIAMSALEKANMEGNTPPHCSISGE